MDKHQMAIAELGKYIHAIDMDLKSLHQRVQKLEEAQKPAPKAAPRKEPKK